MNGQEALPVRGDNATSEAFQGFVCTSAAIDAAVSERAIPSHPFYQAFIAGKVSRDELTHFAREYAHHVWAFPRVVSAIHTNCPDALGRRLLAKNLAEEQGLSDDAVSHADLWLRFAKRLGVDEAALSNAPPSRATQDQLPQIAPSLQAALRRHYDISDEGSLAFFEAHEHADLEHSDVCKELLDKLPRKDRAAAYAGARPASAAHNPEWVIQKRLSCSWRLDPRGEFETIQP